MAALEERLRELEGERAELVKFQQVDKQRRSLEYTIYDTEITDARQALEQARRRPLPAFLLIMRPGGNIMSRAGECILRGISISIRVTCKWYCSRYMP